MNILNGAYTEWLRVTKQGRIILNFDANWHAHRFNEQAADLFRRDEQLLIDMGYNVEPDHEDPIMNMLIPQLPLSRAIRPQWDIACLKHLGACNVTINMTLPAGIMNEYYKIRYRHTPMFMVKIVKA